MSSFIQRIGRAKRTTYITYLHQDTARIVVVLSVRTDDDSELAFTHDGLNRLLTAATGAGGVQPLVTLTNAYGAVGNRISLTDDAGVAGAVTGYAHDGAGRLTQLTTAAGHSSPTRPAPRRWPTSATATTASATSPRSPSSPRPATSPTTISSA
jgi:YD repeat-containing protein